MQDRRSFRICLQVPTLHQKFLFPQYHTGTAEPLIQLVAEECFRNLRLYDSRLLRCQKAVCLQPPDFRRNIGFRFPEIGVLEKGMDRCTPFRTGKPALFLPEIRTFPDRSMVLSCLLNC